MSDMLQHEVITAWAKHRFNLPDDAVIKIEQETISRGYCETCYSESEEWRVMRKDGKEWVGVSNFYDDYVSLLREILDFAAGMKGETK